MEQVDVIPQHCFSAHPQPKSSSMKKSSLIFACPVIPHGVRPICRFCGY